MKKTFLSAIALVGLLGFVVSPANAASVSYYTTFDAVNNYADFTLSQFSTSLGNLTAVTITVNFSTLQGSFDVGNTTGSVANVNQANNELTIAGVTAGLGYATKYADIHDMVTTPDWNTFSISANGSQTFSIAGGQNLLTNDQTVISSSNFGAYKGTGVITMKAKAVNSVTTTGVSYNVSSAATSANTKVTVTYTFDAIPEPATMALVVGGLGMLAIGRRLRRSA